VKVRVVKQTQDLGGNVKCVEYLEEVSLLIERNNKLYFIRYSLLSVWHSNGKRKDYFSIDSIVVFKK